MNFEKLFEIQAGLDEHIIQEKGLQGQDLLDKKILALQVELGELANEWRGFKFWSNDQEPRTWYPNEKDICESCKGQPIFKKNNKIIGQCEDCDGCGVHFHNPLLEEYVDCLHFIFSIGNDLEIKEVDVGELGDYTEETETGTFNQLFSYASALNTYLDANLPASISKEEIQDEYGCMFACFIGLGEKYFEFTIEQIVQAYLEKNKINHERQNTGY
ncbi:dUTP diphosphatase [Gracilibacillus marinus]|uniref:dUTP diphosphatase n=1 Tax=Gracilibacillus marinus TaxID=630535 RepID=A0ABV8W1E2_9BACI